MIGTTHYAGQSQRKTTCPQASRLRSVCPQRQPSTTKGCVGVQSRQKLDKNDCDRTRGIDCDDSPNAQSESKATLPRAGMDAWIYRRLPKPKARTAKEGGRSSRAHLRSWTWVGAPSRLPPEPCPPPKQLNFNKAQRLVRRNPAQKYPGEPLDASGSFRDGQLARASSGWPSCRRSVPGGGSHQLRQL